MSYLVAELKPETRSLGLCSPCNSWFISRETRPGLWGHLPGGRTTCDCGPSCGPRPTSFSLWVSISSSTIWDQSLCIPSRKDQGKAALGRTRVSGTPPPSSRWGNGLSSNECPPRGDRAGLCRTRVDGTESQPGGCCSHTCHKQCASVNGQPACVLTLTLPHTGWLWTSPAPPWGPAAPPLWQEGWTKQRTSTLSYELHSEGIRPVLELWQMTNDT